MKVKKMKMKKMKLAVSDDNIIDDEFDDNADMLNKLRTYLGIRYHEEDWKEAVDSLFTGDSDINIALDNLVGIKAHYIPVLSDTMIDKWLRLEHQDDPTMTVKLLVASRQLGDPRDIGKLRQEHHLLEHPAGVDHYNYRGQKYIHGLMCIERYLTDVIRISLPTTQDIALHKESGRNPEFVSSTMHIYSAQHWIEGDEVQVVSGAMSGTWGIILAVMIDDGTALVDLAYVPGSNSELIDIDVPVSFPIMDLRRRIRTGYHVRVLDTSAEKSEYKGKEGIVLEVVGDTLVVRDSVTKSEFVVSSNSIQTNIVDRGLSASFSTIAQTSTALPDDLKAMRGPYAKSTSSKVKGNGFHEAMSSEASESPHPTSKSAFKSTSVPRPNPWSLDPSIERETSVFEEAPSTVPVIQVTSAYDPWRVNPDDEGEKNSDIPDSSRGLF
ncbi:hypothetical protein DFJ58DRAFT_841639 [Suillus subalutaceus]|uniref:uncharacterized protein n=1 Tax=Suillus subalutaceus TaxID=48586 RepID=UPI001B85DC44|nr:uncharacterized protein DFJ58DRAFT_841639 [Suillus subalutaceus]KAG1853456.1 hypothetical protein DFJ58DRAFT_841639 [Suillus subalutaceus]